MRKWKKRARIYYCDLNRSDQKGALEKNHEYIRYVLPKGAKDILLSSVTPSSKDKEVSSSHSLKLV